MKKLIALASIIIVLALGYGGVWLWAAGQASDYVKTLESADGVTTPRLTCGTFGISGFPFGFDATCTDATIVAGDLTISVPGIKASTAVYRPTHVLVFAQSPVSVDDAFTGSRSRLDFEAVQASVRLTGWRIGRASMVMDAPIWNDTVLEDRLLANAKQLEFHLIDMPGAHDAAAGLAGLAQYAAVEGLHAPGLQLASAQSSFESQLTGIPDDLRNYGDAGLLQNWQAAGGKLLVSAFQGADGEAVHFNASGTLGLDSAGRGEGQLKVTSLGVVERLGTLIPEQYRGLILGTPAEDGSYSQTVNIAAGVVFSGLIPAAMLPPLF